MLDNDESLADALRQNMTDYSPIIGLDDIFFFINVTACKDER